MTSLITKRQQEVLEFIRHSVTDQGYPPSLREIGSHLKINGTRAVEKHLNALEKKGYIRKGIGARALEVIGHRTGRAVPIIGRVAAGRPILAEEYIEGNLIIDEKIDRGKDTFFLRVVGESMKDVGILHGDLVLVKPQPDANSGEIVVAMVEGEATVKRLIKKRKSIVLQPENDAFVPIIMTGKNGVLEIVGKVIGLVRTVI